MLTRKELAERISTLRKDIVTDEQVRKNEKSWGLSVARRDLNRRVIRYDEKIALSALRAAGVIR